MFMFCRDCISVATGGSPGMDIVRGVIIFALNRAKGVQDEKTGRISTGRRRNVHACGGRRDRSGWTGPGLSLRDDCESPDHPRRVTGESETCSKTYYSADTKTP